MSQLRKDVRRLGLVDHDLELRHRGLGWLQAGMGAILFVYVTLLLLMRTDIQVRMLVVPAGLLLGLFAQHWLWKRNQDRWAGHLMGASLLAASAVGFAVNGPAAPVLLTPVICAFIVGYMLGSRAGWTYAVVGMLLAWGSWFGREMGWIVRDCAPPEVWFRVLVILDLSAVQALVFLVFGVRSARRLQEQEAEALGAVLQTLEMRKVELEAEIRVRTRDLERANQELAQFGQTVSHDLRLPLNAIRCHLEAIEPRKVRPDAAVLERLRKRSAELDAFLDRTLAGGAEGGAA